MLDSPDVFDFVVSWWLRLEGNLYGRFSAPNWAENLPYKLPSSLSHQKTIKSAWPRGYKYFTFEFKNYVIKNGHKYIDSNYVHVYTEYDITSN